MTNPLSNQQIASALQKIEDCLGEERPMDAVADLQSILAIDPDHPLALCGIGRVSIQLGDNEAALQALDRAISLSPDMLEARNARGVAYQNLGRFDAAEQEFRYVSGIVPDNPGAKGNLASVLAAKGENELARETFQQVLKLCPGDPTATYNLSLLDLVEGRFEDGWEGFEFRDRASNIGLAAGRSKKPRWEGAKIQDARLLVQAEQGLGDNIQFVRYVADLSRFAGKLILEAPAALKDLFSTVPGPDQVVGSDEPLPEHDFQIPIMSLPAVLRTVEENIPWTGPYLSAPPAEVDAWRKKLSMAKSREDTGGLNIGLVWAGNPSHKRDQERSVPLAALAPLAEVPNVFFHGLQVGDAGSAFTGSAFANRGRRLFRRKRPFKEVAAAIAALDLVIGVDTSLIHLAGAMGKPVWTMITRVPDWRWMLGRNDTPWYPTMRLFRQPVAGDWGSVANTIAAELGKLR